MQNERHICFSMRLFPFLLGFEDEEVASVDFLVILDLMGAAIKITPKSVVGYVPTAVNGLPGCKTFALFVAVMG